MSGVVRLAVVAFLALHPPTALAQTNEALHPGMRIRVSRIGESRRAIGLLQDVDTASITLVPGQGSPLMIPLADIRSIKVSAGTYRPLARGALWGGLAGLALGTVLMLADGQCVDCVDGDGGGVIVIGFTTVIGAVFGLAAGSTIVQDRWQTIQLPHR